MTRNPVIDSTVREVIDARLETSEAMAALEQHVSTSAAVYGVMQVAVYRSNTANVPEDARYWFLRIINPVTESSCEQVISQGKARDLMTLGVPRLEDGGNL